MAFGGGPGGPGGPGFYPNMMRGGGFGGPGPRFPGGGPGGLMMGPGGGWGARGGGMGMGMGAMGPRGGFFGGNGGGAMGGGGGWGQGQGGQQQFDEDVDFGQGGQQQQQGPPVFGDGGAAFQTGAGSVRGGMAAGGGRGGGAAGGGGGGFGPWQMNPADVMAWLDHQHPFVLKRIHFHARWLLQQHGCDPDEEGGGEEGNEGADGEEEEGGEEESGGGDTSGWYDEAAINTAQMRGGGGGSGPQQPLAPPGPGPMSQRPRPPWQRAPGPVPGPQQMQWTPAGWAVKDNSHKVTTTMRPLPEQDFVPPQSPQHPQANADREKLRMLRSNVNMMQFELNKICKRFRIISLNKEDLSVYPEEQRGKLKVAVNCVAAAEKTLNDFRDFLKNDKYKDWNEEQKRRHEEKVKSMIGETPTGVPHKRPNQDGEEEGQGEENGGEEASSSSAKQPKMSGITFKPGGKLST